MTPIIEKIRKILRLGNETRIHNAITPPAVQFELGF